MNPSEISPIQHNLQIALSENRITRQAEDIGFLTRHRTILPYPLVISVLTALGKDSNAETLQDLCRKFNEMTGLNVSRHAWREQVIKPEFVTLLIGVFKRSLVKMTKKVLSFAPESPFAQFEHIWLHDGSSQAVVDRLAEILPGRFKTVSPAAIEMHATMDLLNDNLVRLDLTEDTHSERACLPVLQHDLSSTLMLKDAGYFDLEDFMAVDDRGGNFVCRAPQSINPVVRKALRSDGKNCHRFEQQKLKDIVSHFPKDGCMDLDVEWPKARGWIFRLVVAWNGKKNKWIFIVSNLCRESFSMNDVFLVYRLRWQIELFFKEIKSYACWHRFNTGCTTLVVSLILASFTVVVLKRSLAHAAEQGIDREISTRKALMSGTHLYGDMMLALLGHNRRRVSRTLKKLLEFWQENGQREHPARDRRNGRSTLGLTAVGCA